MPKRPCQVPGCKGFATYRGRCPAHAQRHDSGLNRAGREIYSTKRWKILRRHIIGQNPICEHCGNALAEHAHHKHGVENDAWSVDGIEALCARCHAKHHAGSRAAV